MKQLQQHILEKLKISKNIKYTDALELFEDFINGCKKHANNNSEWVCYLPSLNEYKKRSKFDYDNLPKIKLDKQYFKNPKSLQSEEGYLIEIVIYFSDEPRIFLKYLKDDYKSDKNFRIYTTILINAENLVDVIDIDVLKTLNKYYF